MTSPPFTRPTTAAALAAIRPLERPAALVHCLESRLFSDLPVAAEIFPRVFVCCPNVVRRQLPRTVIPAALSRSRAMSSVACPAEPVVVIP
jgi:hypothetical protein